jgi:hypothetical protein
MTQATVVIANKPSPDRNLSFNQATQPAKLGKCAPIRPTIKMGVGAGEALLMPDSEPARLL